MIFLQVMKKKAVDIKSQQFKFSNLTRKLVRSFSTAFFWKDHKSKSTTNFIFVAKIVINCYFKK